MCRHPETKLDDNPMGALIQMMSGKTSEAARKLNIQGDPIGIRRGWFMWPANFDPNWLRNCDGFEPKLKDTNKE